MTTAVHAPSKVISGLQKRIWIFPGLAIITLIIGQLCKTSCTFLEGDILGIDLNVFGGAFYLLLLIAGLYYQINPAAWLMKGIACLAALGTGAEIVFIKFQVQNSTYCPKCLGSGFFLLMMFFLLSPYLKKWAIVLLVAAGALFTSVTFNGSIIPSYAAETRGPQFGNSRAQPEVILYSDYFCPACRQADIKINEALLRIKKKVRIRFVDVPGHPGSAEYSKVFLYSWLQSGNNLETAVKVREILFQESLNKTDQQKLMGILKTKGIGLKIDEPAAMEIFRNVYNPSMKADTLKATPTLVVVKGSERKKYVGGPDILKALDELSSAK